MQKKYGKSGYATAIISENTLAIYTSENIEYPKPINWTRTIKEMKIYNKSHIIGYSLSAKKAKWNLLYSNLTTIFCKCINKKLK